MPRVSSVITADLLQAQVATAGDVLQWLQAKAKRTRVISTAGGLLVIGVYLIDRIIRQIREHGPERFDPENAGVLVDKFGILVSSVRSVLAHGDVSGMAACWPLTVLYRRLRFQAGELRTIRERFNEIDLKWKATVSDAAEASIRHSRDALLSAQQETDVILSSEADYEDGPSERAIRAHLARTIALVSDPSDN